MLYLTGAPLREDLRIKVDHYLQIYSQLLVLLRPSLCTHTNAIQTIHSHPHNPPTPTHTHFPRRSLSETIFPESEGSANSGA